jgi:S1-C subfamily serine protease
MWFASKKIKTETKQDDSLELSCFFVLRIFLLSFLTACTTINQIRNTSSSLQINTGDVATGTGFLFSSSDYVITSYHVVHGAKSIKVRLVNGERIDATISLKDTNNDIAILKLSQSPTSRQNIIVLGDSSSVKTGDRVFTYGFPLVDLLGAAEPRYSEGFINSLSGISNDPRLFQVSIPIQPGNSGGPVFNEKGELIGIATSSIDADKTKKVFGSSPQNVNFAIKSSYIKSLLPNLPDVFLRDKGIVVVPVEEVGFKERVKNDIVLVEATPEFKPTIVKRDYKDEGQLREERERQAQEEESLRKEKEIAERERELLEREKQVETEEQLRRERELAEREQELRDRERQLEEKKRLGSFIKRERGVQKWETNYSQAAQDECFREAKLKLKYGKSKEELRLQEELPQGVDFHGNFDAVPLTPKEVKCLSDRALRESIKKYSK